MCPLGSNNELSIKVALKFEIKKIVKNILFRLLNVDKYTLICVGVCELATSVACQNINKLGRRGGRSHWMVVRAAPPDPDPDSDPDSDPDTDLATVTGV